VRHLKCPRGSRAEKFAARARNNAKLYVEPNENVDEMNLRYWDESEHERLGRFCQRGQARQGSYLVRPIPEVNRGTRDERLILHPDKNVSAGAFGANRSLSVFENKTDFISLTDARSLLRFGAYGFTRKADADHVSRRSRY
jgi:hypothetical protein